MPYLRAAFCLVLFWVAVPVQAVDEALLRSYVAADGVTDAGILQARIDVVRQAIESVAGRGEDQPGYRRARALHHRIQRRLLQHYNEDSDSLGRLAQHGMYNCVSATLFYGLVYRSQGYRPEVLAFPGHLMVRIHIDDRVIDIETTSRDGFDVGWFAERWGRKLNRQQVDSLRPLRRDPIARLQQTEGMYWQVPLEVASGLARLNVAWDALDHGDLEQASIVAAAAASFMDELARQTEGIKRLFERSHRIAYERGEFDLAYRISWRELQTFGARTSTVDRLHMAGVKRIESRCDRDDPARALELLEELTALSMNDESADRIGRQVLPLIVACAVRNRSWDIATRGANLYAEAETDEVENQRLQDWLASRSDAR